jgi:hypothetical protein
MSNQLAHKTIDNLFEKYNADDYMTSKIQTYICDQLPAIFENMDRIHNERIIRIQELSAEQDVFIQCFLNKNQYFYIPTTEKFFYYDGLHYQEINEDDILYNVLSTITKDRSNLMSWKQRTKINIMKRIKENSLLNTIPESDTIQYVLDILCPTLFSKRSEAKYFLTILGDNILRKNTNLIHFIYSKSKQFLQSLNNICQMHIGIGLYQSFRHKYYEHVYQDCRLVKINETVKTDIVWNSLVYQSSLDIICVACHYSIRYKSSDQYLSEFSNDEVLTKSVFFIKELQPEDVIQKFIQEYLDTSTDAHISMSWKNMQYLWKQFLDSKNLPSIIFMQNLKQLITEKLKVFYKEDQEVFIGVYSKHLPAIQKFLTFWNDTMVFDETEYELEIEEIILLCKKWCQNRGESLCILNDKQMIDVLINYFPNIEIENEKYISKIRCRLWDKQLDIQIALDKLVENIRLSNQQSFNYSIYDAYSFYCKQQNTINVSKSYFEKYIFDHFPQYVVDGKFLSNEWSV